MGDPCTVGQDCCLESWGEPGGHSSALWCRLGVWRREQEVNLPDEPRDGRPPLAEQIEPLTGIGFDIVGFDTGEGLPQLQASCAG